MKDQREGPMAGLRKVAGVDDDALLADALATRTVGELLDALAKAGVPAELVRQDRETGFFDGMTPGAVSAEAAAIDVVALVACRELDTVLDPSAEPGAYSNSSDVRVDLDVRLIPGRGPRLSRRLRPGIG